MHRCKSGDPGTPWRTGLTSTPLGSLTYLKGLRYCFHFSIASPVLLLPLPPPAPIGTFFALPVLYQLAQKEWAPCNSRSRSRGVRLPTELHGCADAETCPEKDLCRLCATSPPLACPRDPPEPHSPSTQAIFQVRNRRALLCVSNKTWLLGLSPIIEQEKEFLFQSKGKCHCWFCGGGLAGFPVWFSPILSNTGT